MEGKSQNKIQIFTVSGGNARFSRILSVLGGDGTWKMVCTNHWKIHSFLLKQFLTDRLTDIFQLSLLEFGILHPPSQPMAFYLLMTPFEYFIYAMKNPLREAMKIAN